MFKITPAQKSFACLRLLVIVWSDGGVGDVDVRL